jgi:adenosylhomocysteine nucleosidase
MERNHHPGISRYNIGVNQLGSHNAATVGELNVNVNDPQSPGSAHAGGTGTQPPGRRADIGVIAVLRQEMQAVVGAFQRARSYRSQQLHGGAAAHEADFPASRGMLHAVAMQALVPGQRSAVSAYHRLREHYAPPIVLLVGVAGAIHPKVAVGDVVIADEVIYYDARRDSPQGPHRRGQAYPIPAVMQHRLNDYFQVRGDTGLLAGGSRFTVHLGPIGSGEAVITDEASEVRRWLRQVNEKTLAVETEIGGVVQAFHEEVQHDAALRGWSTIRGISDAANAGKGHAYHDQASERAAMVLERLMPFLQLSSAEEG